MVEETVATLCLTCGGDVSGVGGIDPYGEGTRRRGELGARSREKGSMSLHNWMGGLWGISSPRMLNFKRRRGQFFPGVQRRGLHQDTEEMCASLQDLQTLSLPLPPEGVVIFMFFKLRGRGPRELSGVMLMFSNVLWSRLQNCTQLPKLNKRCS